MPTRSISPRTPWMLMTMLVSDEQCWRVVIHEDANLILSCAIFEAVVVVLVLLKTINLSKRRTEEQLKSQQSMNNASVSLSTKTQICLLVALRLDQFLLL